MRLTGEVVRPRLIEPSAKRRARRRETLIVQMTANAPSGRGRESLRRRRAFGGCISVIDVGFKGEGRT
jgi:hypothetical protein